MLSRREFGLSAGGLMGCGGFAAPPAQPLRLSAPRAVHNMVRLGDGSVLIIGGCTSRGCAATSATVDRYDPKTRTISQIGHLLGPRGEGAAAALPDGTVLLAGGWIAEGKATAVLERFDPRSGRSTLVGERSQREAVQAIPMADGRVLMVGEKAIDIFDPATLKVAVVTTASPFLEAGTATLLRDGRVLTVGGGTYGKPPTAEAHLIDPRSGRVERTGSLAAVRIKHAAVPLLDGKVLIVGGSDERGRDGGKTRDLELYDPAKGRFTRVGQTLDARYKIGEGALRLSDGRVLVVGGADRPEVIDPATWTSRNLPVSIGDTLNFTTAAALPNGDVLFAGGYGERTIRPTDQAWLIRRELLS